MKTFEVKITKEVYTKGFGWVVKNESLIIEAENKEDAYFEASAKGTVLFVKTNKTWLLHLGVALMGTVKHRTRK